MPGERSLYRKIQIVLDSLKRESVASVEEIVEAVYVRHEPGFAYYWRDSETDRILHDYSRRSIHATVVLCVHLRFAEAESGTVRITKLGIRATDDRRYPVLLGQQAKSLLEESGIDLESILAAIRQVIGGDQPKPPAATEIWGQLDNESANIDFEDFRRLLGLLGQCQLIIMTQRRIFLPYAAD